MILDAVRLSHGFTGIGQHEIVAVANVRYSSANTLIMNRLKFSREKLSKHPDVLGQSCRHGGRALAPLGLNHPLAHSFLRGDLHPQTHVGSREVEGLKKDYSPSHLLARFAKGAALTHQGGQRVTEG